MFTRSNQDETSGFAPALLVTAVLLWSGNFVVGRALGGEVSALGLNFLRWLLAFVILVPLAARELHRCRHLVVEHWWYLLALGLTGVAAFHVLVYKALEHTSVTNALLVLSTAPALIMLLSRWMLGETLGPWRQLGIGLSFAGAVVLICRGDPAALSSLSLGEGELWMLAAAPTWAVYSVLLKRRPPTLPQRATLAASTATGLLCMAPLVLLSPSVLEVSWTPAIGGAIAYVGIGASVIAFWCWNRGVARTGPARAGVYLHLMPLFGALLGFAILGEGLYPYHALGGALVLAGIFFTRFEPAARPLHGLADRAS